MAVLIQYPKFQAFDSDGHPLSGGKLYTYEAGGSAVKSTYANASMSSANTNPVILNSRGEAIIYGTGAYRMILTDSSDVQVWDQDYINTTP